MEKSQIESIIEEAHRNSITHGFYEGKSEDSNIKEKLLLIHQEISEAVEALRKNNRCSYNSIKKVDAILSSAGFSVEKFNPVFKDNIKDTFEDEIADALIRIFDLCGYMDIPIDKFIAVKMVYNSSRPYKHGKEF